MLQKNLIALREKFTRRLNDSDLRTICSDLHDMYPAMGLDYDSLSGNGKADKIRELIDFLDRREYIPRLMAIIEHERLDLAESDGKEEYPDYQILFGNAQKQIGPERCPKAKSVEGRIRVRTLAKHTGTERPPQGPDSNTIAFWHGNRFGVIKTRKRGNAIKEWNIERFYGPWWIARLTVLEFEVVPWREDT
jgi:hypothetical protein